MNIIKTKIAEKRVKIKLLLSNPKRSKERILEDIHFIYRSDPLKAIRLYSLFIRKTGEKSLINKLMKDNIIGDEFKIIIIGDLFSHSKFKNSELESLITKEGYKVNKLRMKIDGMRKYLNNKIMYGPIKVLTILYSSLALAMKTIDNLELTSIILRIGMVMSFYFILKTNEFKRKLKFLNNSSNKAISIYKKTLDIPG